MKCDGMLGELGMQSKRSQCAENGTTTWFSETFSIPELFSSGQRRIRIIPDLEAPFGKAIVGTPSSQRELVWSFGYATPF